MDGLRPNWKLGSEFRCPCGETHRIATEETVVGEDAMPRLKARLEKFKGKSVLAVYDKNTFDVAGVKVREALKPLGSSAEEFVFASAQGDLPADMGSLDKLREEFKAKGPALALAVGSGVISDLVKVSANAAEIPYISVPTAPSMDGYLSANAALLENGMKKQFNKLRPPAGLFADIEIVAAAPDEMLRSGLGDAFGKFTSLYEWKMNKEVVGESFCEETAAMLEASVEELLSEAEKSELRAPELVAKLMNVLLLTGLAMQAVGKSAPASCGEHCVSHVLEMHGYAAKGHAPSRHGLQVAWGAKALLDAYKAAPELVAKRPADIQALRKEYASHKGDWRKAGVDIDSSIDSKIKLLDGCAEKLGALLEDEGAAKLLSAAGRLEKAYRKHSLPSSFSMLGIDREEAAFALRHSVDIRQRICVFDLLHSHSAMNGFIQKELR